MKLGSKWLRSLADGNQIQDVENYSILFKIFTETYQALSDEAFPAITKAQGIEI